MKYKVLIMLFGALLATAALASEVNESLDAAADGHVDIYNTSGSIEVYGWSKNEVEVTGTLGSKVEELVFERDGDRITVKVKVPRNFGNSISSDLVVRVPEDSSIDVSAVSADIEIEGVKGVQGLHSVSGDVETEAFGSDLELASVSGDIEVSGDNKSIETKATTVSGDLTLFRVSGTVEVEVVSGDLTIDEGSYDRANITTVNGDLFYQAGFGKTGKMYVESVNGEVDVIFADEVSAEFDIETFNGDIDVCFGPEAQRTSKYAPGYELSFTHGDGDGRVVVNTLNGDVDICTK